MVFLTRKEHFNAAHKLYNKAWDSEKNREVFGPCANENFHGHNYELWVTVGGTPDPDTGFVMNARDLSEIIKSEILERFDHKNLNEEIDYFNEIQPSTENFVIYIWELLETKLPKGLLHCVKLMETENIYAEYYGKKG